MDVSQVTLTVVEHEGRRWLLRPDGSILGKTEGELGPCDETTAVQAVRDRLDADRRNAAFYAAMKTDRATEVKWREAVRRAIDAVNGSRTKGSEANDAWARRIDTSAKALYLMVKRGSNLKERLPSVQRFGTWERMLAVAYQRAMQWNDCDQWDTYSNNLASNVRKRFRNAGADQPRPQADGGHEQEEGRACDPERPGVQVLFDWR